MTTDLKKAKRVLKERVENIVEHYQMGNIRDLGSFAKSLEIMRQDKEENSEFLRDLEEVYFLAIEYFHLTFLYLEFITSEKNLNDLLITHAHVSLVEFYELPMTERRATFDNLPSVVQNIFTVRALSKQLD